MLFLILGILVYSILTKFIFTVYSISDIRAEKIPLKLKIMKYFFMTVIGWLIALLVLIGIALGFTGAFLFEKIIGCEDYIDEF